MTSTLPQQTFRWDLILFIFCCSSMYFLPVVNQSEINIPFSILNSYIHFNQSIIDTSRCSGKTATKYLNLLLFQINIDLGRQEQKWPVSIEETVSVNAEGEISLNEIILRLKRKNFNEVFDSSISYYHHARQLYVYGFFLPKTLS